jgi:hypothetical protein
MECSDPSRNVFRIKDNDGNVIRDLKAAQLTSIIAEPVKLKSDQILREIDEDCPWMSNRGHEIAIELRSLQNENSVMCKELAVLTTTSL